jgi:protein-S-isoprenylcysteine O-methyltransferase Ste14
MRGALGPQGGRVSGLELKVPPDVVWLAVGVTMWLASKVTPGLTVPLPLRLIVAGLCVALGVGLVVGARVMLDRAHTTWHPTEPERTTSLVSGGVFRFSRNPTYLGMLLVLVGWGVVLANPLAFVLAAIFALWMSRFQIRPEERVLSALLGQEYRDYASRVRRWV